jgi:hypothetical protein
MRERMLAGELCLAAGSIDTKDLPRTWSRPGTPHVSFGLSEGLRW